MSVKVRPYKTGGWEVDVRVALPDRTVIRERRKAPTRSESGARRWGLAREKEILLHGPAKPRKEVPTLTEFYPRFPGGVRQGESAEAERHRGEGVDLQGPSGAGAGPEVAGRHH